MLQVSSLKFHVAGWRGVLAMWLVITALAPSATTKAAQVLSPAQALADLGHEDPSIRLLAVKLLRERKHVEAIEPIAALIGDADDRVQREAIGAELALLCAEAIPEPRRRFISLDVGTKSDAESAFNLGPEAVAPETQIPTTVVSQLLNATKDESIEVRKDAIYALGVIGKGRLTTDHTSVLTAALVDLDSRVRVAALRTLGRLKVKEASHRMIAAMNDRDKEVRIAAIAALGTVKSESALQPLRERFEHRRRGAEGEAALDALAHMGAPSIVPFFEALLSDKRETVRRLALEGLARNGAVLADDVLDTHYLKETSTSVRLAIEWIRVRAGRRSALDELMEAAVDTPNAKQAEGYLLEMDAQFARSLFIYFRDPDHETRALAARIVGRIGGQDAIEPLAPLTQDRSPNVVVAATDAMRRLTRVNSSS